MTCLILVSINIKASAPSLPLVVHSGHWNNSHLNKMLGFLLMRILISQYNTMTVVNKMLGFVLMRILITMAAVIMAIMMIVIRKTMIITRKRRMFCQLVPLSDSCDNYGDHEE